VLRQFFCSGNQVEANVSIINSNLCYGIADASVEIITNGGVAPFDYSLNGAAPVDANVFGNLPAGMHTVVVHDSHGCPSEVQFEIDAQAEVVIENLSTTNTDCGGTVGGAAEISISGGAGNYNYAWSNGMDTPQIDNLTAGVYTLTVTDANNCANVFEVEIGRDDVEIPPVFNTVFTPNFDGINDTWVIGNLELYPDNEVVVINRWGNEVFTQKAYDNLWDGSDLSEGTYFYILNVNICNDEKKYTGYITILK